MFINIDSILVLNITALEYCIDKRLLSSLTKRESFKRNQRSRVQWNSRWIFWLWNWTKVSLNQWNHWCFHRIRWGQELCRKNKIVWRYHRIFLTLPFGRILQRISFSQTRLPAKFSGLIPSYHFWLPNWATFWIHIISTLRHFLQN